MTTKILIKIKKFIKKHQAFKKFLVRFKKIVFSPILLIQFIKQIFINIHNKRLKKKKEAESNYFAHQTDSGFLLYGYIKSSRIIDEKTHKLKIPDEIRQIKIDIGLSFNAPNSARWLETLPDRIIFGFEPNPENVYEIISGTNKKRGSAARCLDAKYINKRFFLFNVAIDNGEPYMKKFYMAEEDPGTSSLYEPNYFKIKNVIMVPSIRLADFLSLIPWERFDYIEHIKVDTQGNDLRILQSADSFLSERVLFVTAECSTGNQYIHSHTENELDTFMSQSGFEFIPNTNKNNNKTYVNLKFKHLMNEMDYQTE